MEIQLSLATLIGNFGCPCNLLLKILLTFLPRVFKIVDCLIVCCSPLQKVNIHAWVKLDIANSNCSFVSSKLFLSDIYALLHTEKKFVVTSIILLDHHVELSEH